MIEFSEVTKSYSVGTHALRGIDLQIEDGDFVFLVGPSGSGKSTIIKLITGELRPTSGTVHVNGYSLERIRKREIPYLRRTVGAQHGTAFLYCVWSCGQARYGVFWFYQ